MLVESVASFAVSLLLQWTSSSGWVSTWLPCCLRAEDEERLDDLECWREEEGSS